MPYLNITEVESGQLALSAAFPGLCELITLPNSSHEGRTSHAMRIASGPLDNRPAMLFIGGQHAREWGSCEICINLAADLLEAYSTNAGLTYGGTSFPAGTIRNIVENRQIFIFPLVNPDGRHHSQTVYAMWRKNRNPAGAVDLNRNYDFLWDFRATMSPSSPLVVSDNPSSDVYHGTAPESEPETRNVVWLLDQYPQIRWMIDIHSYSQLLYHNWGDDQNQVSDPGMNFLNPAHHGARGVAGDAYREFIQPGDLAAQRCLVNGMKGAISAVRGKNYTTGQSFSLYPTTGTATDYPYSRHIADPAKTKTMGFLIEWGTEFQPPWTEMELIVQDISAGLVEFARATSCPCSELNATLLTSSVVFNDVPELETTARAIVFSVSGCQGATFQVVSGPSVLSGPGAFMTLPSPGAVLPAVSGPALREARIWISHTGTAAGSSTTGTVTVRLAETDQEWVIPITANSIARPTVASVLVLDQSGSMLWNSGLPSLPTRNHVLKFSAPMFVNLLQEHNGIGIVAFDHDAFDRMAVDRVSVPGAFDPARNNALSVIGGHTPNPSGATAIGDGLENARLMLNNASGYMHKAIVVFTDGHETAAKYISEVAPLIDSRVFAIGLGTAAQIQPAALSALTNGTEGYLLLTGNLGPDDTFRLSKYFLQILAGVTNQDIVLDPEGSILPGQVHRIPFVLNEADISVDAILLGETNLPVIGFALESPAGDLINPGIAATTPGARFVSAQGVNFYRCTLPVPLGTAGAREGTWNVLLEVDKVMYKRYLSTLDKYPEWYQRVLTHGVGYNLSVQSYSGIRMQARLLQNSMAPGARLTVRAALTEYGMPVPGTRATVRAELRYPDGSQAGLTLLEQSPGSGIFVAEVLAAMEGVYHFRLLSAGQSLRGRAFTREQLLTGAVWRGGDNPPPAGGERPDKDQLCKLLSCLLNGKVIRPELEKRLQEWGIDVDDLRRCLKSVC